MAMGTSIAQAASGGFLAALSSFGHAVAGAVTSAVSTIASAIGMSVTATASAIGALILAISVAGAAGVVSYTATQEAGKYDSMIDCAEDIKKDLEVIEIVDANAQKLYNAKCIYSVLHELGLPDINIAGFWVTVMKRVVSTRLRSKRLSVTSCIR